MCARIFDYPKRAELLESSITDTLEPNSEKRRKLKDCCRTRWIEKLDSFYIFTSLYKAIVVALSTVAFNGRGHWNNDSVALAWNLLHGITTFVFFYHIRGCRKYDGLSKITHCEVTGKKG